MQPKSYEILLDIKQGLMNNQIIEVVTGDYGMNNFKFKLLRDRLVPYDLTNTIVRIMVVTPGGSEQQQDCIVENPVGGTVDLTLKQSLFVEPGEHIAELQVYDKDTQVLRVTFPRFRYYARKSLQDDETIQASDEYSILQQMIEDVGDINNNINAKVEAHNQDEESHEDIRSLMGMLSDLTTDEKANLVQAINEIKSQSNDIATGVSAHKTQIVSEVLEVIRDLSILGIQNVPLGQEKTPKSITVIGLVVGTNMSSTGFATRVKETVMYTDATNSVRYNNPFASVIFSSNGISQRTRAKIALEKGNLKIDWAIMTGNGATGTANLSILVNYHE